MRSGNAFTMDPFSRALPLIAVLAVILPVSLAAQTITVTVSGSDPDNWYVGSFGPADIALPGNDFTSSTQPAGAGHQVDIDIAGFPGASPVLIYIRKDADELTTWNGTYTLWIRRVDDGTGTGSITWVSTGWVPITSTDTNLFEVRKDRSGVTVELQLQSLLVAAGTTSSSPSFQTTLTYTAVK